MLTVSILIFNKNSSQKEWASQFHLMGLQVSLWLMLMWR